MTGLPFFTRDRRQTYKMAGKHLVQNRSHHALHKYSDDFRPITHFVSKTTEDKAIFTPNSKYVIVINNDLEKSF